MRRFGSLQVRVSGTVGGNIANGSPIGDLAPALIALGATRRAAQGRDDPVPCRSRTSSSPMASRTARRASSCARSPLPRLGEGQHYRAFKVSKRFDEDISAVMLGARFDARRPTHRRRAHRLRRHGGDAQARGGGRAALTGADLDEPASWRGALSAPRLGLHAVDRPARERRLSHDSRGERSRKDADGNLRRNCADPHRRCSMLLNRICRSASLSDVGRPQAAPPRFRPPARAGIGRLYR